MNSAGFEDDARAAGELDFDQAAGQLQRPGLQRVAGGRSGSGNLPPAIIGRRQPGDLLTAAGDRRLRSRLRLVRPLPDHADEQKTKVCPNPVSTSAANKRGEALPGNQGQPSIGAAGAVRLRRSGERTRLGRSGRQRQFGRLRRGTGRRQRPVHARRRRLDGVVEGHAGVQAEIVQIGLLGFRAGGSRRVQLAAIGARQFATCQ